MLHKVTAFSSLASSCQVDRKPLWRLTYLVVKEDQVLGYELVSKKVLNPIGRVVRLYPKKNGMVGDRRGTTENTRTSNRRQAFG